MVKITCLVENTTVRPDITPEHGLSLYIQANGRTILFDMGQTEYFAANAAVLGVDLAAVDTAILSHGHYDHGGGMACFLTTNERAPVYHSSLAFGSHWHGKKYIGLDVALAEHPRLRPVENVLALGDGFSLCGCHDRACLHLIESTGLTVRKNGENVPECFDHEQYLLVEEAGRRTVISGCSHRGIANIVDWLRPDVLVGGFHLMKLDPSQAEDAARLDTLAAELLYTGATFYTGHCTGEAAYAYLKERMGEKLHYIRAGDSIEV